MSESDLLAALGGAAVPFTVRGVEFKVRPLSYPGAVKYREFRAKNKSDAGACVAALIALSVSYADGRAIPFNLAAKLPAPVADELANRIADVNGWGEAAGN